MKVQNEFEVFMSHAYPGVVKNGAQWKTMELVWHSSAFSVCVQVRAGESTLEEILVESTEFGNNAIKRMMAGEKI